jgi:hypothetical protein
MLPRGNPFESTSTSLMPVDRVSVGIFSRGCEKLPNRLASTDWISFFESVALIVCIEVGNNYKITFETKEFFPERKSLKADDETHRLEKRHFIDDLKQVGWVLSKS